MYSANPYTTAVILSAHNTLILHATLSINLLYTYLIYDVYVLNVKNILTYYSDTVYFYLIHKYKNICSI